MKKYEIHPAALIFPMMTEEEYQGLKKDIAENGQREAVIVWNDQLIDGRNRMQACIELDREPDVAELDSDVDPWKYVISHNLHRRHLTTSQRATVAAKMADLKRGGDRKSDNIKVQNCTLIDDAAKSLKVSARSVKNAKAVNEHGSKAVQDAVEQGKIAVSLAAKLIRKFPDKREQTKILAQGIDVVRQLVKSDKKKAASQPAEKVEVAESVTVINPIEVNKTTQWADVEDDEPDKHLDEVKAVWNRSTAASRLAIREWVNQQEVEG